MAGPDTPGRVDWRARRWTPFVKTITVRGADFGGATLRAQLRLYRDQPGAPMLDLMNAVPQAQGLSVSVDTVAGVPTSTIQIRINETTLEQMLPFPANGLEPEDDVKLAWDLLISGGGYAKARWFEGAFHIIAGATQA